MRWSVIWDYREALLSGLALTLEITALTVVGATMIGVLVACLRQQPSYLWGRLAEAYVEVIRNIPSVIKVFFLYFVAGLDAMPAAVLGLSVHQSSYIADVLDAGFLRSRRRCCRHSRASSSRSSRTRQRPCCSASRS
jgi:His/Glu/Gln/Arg/opine family amino acid ABC transporter permease subunit